MPTPEEKYRLARDLIDSYEKMPLEKQQKFEAKIAPFRQFVTEWEAQSGPTPSSPTGLEAIEQVIPEESPEEKIQRLYQQEVMAGVPRSPEALAAEVYGGKKDVFQRTADMPTRVAPADTSNPLRVEERVFFDPPQGPEESGPAYAERLALRREEALQKAQEEGHGLVFHELQPEHPGAVPEKDLSVFDHADHLGRELQRSAVAGGTAAIEMALPGFPQLANALVDMVEGVPQGQTMERTRELQETAPWSTTVGTALGALTPAGLPQLLGRLLGPAAKAPVAAGQPPRRAANIARSAGLTSAGAAAEETAVEAGRALGGEGDFDPANPMLAALIGLGTGAGAGATGEIGDALYRKLRRDPAIKKDMMSLTEAGSGLSKNPFKTVRPTKAMEAYREAAEKNVKANHRTYGSDIPERQATQKVLTDLRQQAGPVLDLEKEIADEVTGRAARLRDDILPAETAVARATLGGAKKKGGEMLETISAQKEQAFKASQDALPLREIKEEAERVVKSSVGHSPSLARAARRVRRQKPFKNLEQLEAFIDEMDQSAKPTKTSERGPAEKFYARMAALGRDLRERFGSDYVEERTKHNLMQQDFRKLLKALNLPDVSVQTLDPEDVSQLWRMKSAIRGALDDGPEETLAAVQKLAADDPKMKTVLDKLQSNSQQLRRLAKTFGITGSSIDNMDPKDVSQLWSVRKKIRGAVDEPESGIAADMLELLEPKTRQNLERLAAEQTGLRKTLKAFGIKNVKLENLDPDDVDQLRALGSRIRTSISEGEVNTREALNRAIKNDPELQDLIKNLHAMDAWERMEAGSGTRAALVGSPGGQPSARFYGGLDTLKLRLDPMWEALMEGNPPARGIRSMLPIKDLIDRPEVKEEEKAK